VAEELCDQIAIIQKGTVIAQGTMEELQKQADSRDKRLEHLFLKLTGEDDIAETISALQKI
jgi:ABC-2 type transport system ATP-binding protein